MNSWETKANEAQKPIIGTDCNGKITFTNQYLKRIVGDLVGMQLFEIQRKVSDECFEICGIILNLEYVDNIESGSVYVYNYEISQILINQYLSKAWETLEAFVYIAKNDGKIIYLSPKIINLVRKTDISFPDETWDNLGRVFANINLSSEAVLKMLQNEQSDLVLEVTAGPLKGRVVKWNISKFEDMIIGIGLDVTENTKINKELSQNVEFSNVLIETMPLYMLVVKKEGIIFSDPKTKEIFGIPNIRTPVALEAIKFESKSQYEQLISIVDEILARRLRVTSFLAQILDKKAKISDFTVTVRGFVRNDEPEALILLLPMTKMLETQRKLEKREQFLNVSNEILTYAISSDNTSNVFNHSIDTICRSFKIDYCKVLLDKDETFHTVTQMGICAWKPESIDVVASKTFNSGRSQVLLTDKPFNKESLYFIPILGSSKSIGVAIFQLSDGAEDISPILENLGKTLGVAYDNALLRERERRNLDELEKLNKLRIEIIEATSHELKTPLTSIQGYAEYLASGMLTAPDQIKSAAESIGNSSRQLHRLLEDLSRASKETITLPDFECKHVKMKILLDGLAALMLPIFEASNLTFINNVADDVPDLLGDETKVKEIVLNFLSNAAKYTEAGGEVRMSTKTLTDEFAQVSVFDTGIGIPSDQRRVIFMKYGRHAKDREGKGLGLYLSKLYAEAMGGRVYFESEGRGKGTTFHLLFPTAGQQN